MNTNILTAENLSLFCPSEQERKPVKLLDSINIVLNQNEILGIVGEAGSGKTVLIDALGSNIKPPLWVNAEKLVINLDNVEEDLTRKDEEDLRRLWGKDITFIKPNARNRLNPILKVGIQIVNIIQANSTLSQEEAYRKVIEMFKMVQMPDPVRNFDSYPHELSGGMAQRVLISIALSMSPKLLLADEPTIGLDVTIQTQVLDLMSDIFSKLQSAVVLATRDLGIVAHYCNKVAAMCKGQIVEFTDVKDFFENAKHPYSQYLLSAAFSSYGKEVDIKSENIGDRKRKKIQYETGCGFADRCPYARECCSSSPPYVYTSVHQYIRCHRREII